MKIIHLIFSFTIGGAETMLVDILNEQARYTDVELIVVNSEISSALLTKLDRKISVYLVNRQKRTRNPLPIIRLNMHLLKSKPDVIHCHNHNNIRILLPLFRKKSVLTVHATDIPIYNFKGYKKLLAISQAVSDDIKKRSGLSSLVIKNGIDFNKISIRDWNDPRREKNHFKIVQVGRLNTDTKGHHLLIEAIRILCAKGIKDIHVDFIGEGKSIEYLQQLVKIYALKEYITFLGVRDRDYIYTHLKKYDLLIQPSFYEGFGLTIVEAMAAKIPVLVSDIAGPMEVIKNGEYGFFFKTGEVAEIVERIQYVRQISNGEAYSKQIENAYEYAIMNFNIKQTAINYMDNY